MIFLRFSKDDYCNSSLLLSFKPSIEYLVCFVFFLKQTNHDGYCCLSQHLHKDFFSPKFFVVKDITI